MFDIERHHFAQAEAQNGNGLGCLLGQGIEVEHEDADRGVGQDQRHGAALRGQFVEGLADGLDHGVLRLDIGLGDAGHQGAGSEWRERVRRRVAPVRDGGGQNAFRSEFDRGQRAAAVRFGFIFGHLENSVQWIGC